MIRILQSSEAGKLLTRRKVRLAEAEAAVAPILEAVRKRGDKAVLEYARKFDGYKGKSLAVAKPELESAAARLTPAFRAAVGASEANVREFALRQLPREHQKLLKPGLSLGQIVRPLDTVAAYIPGGRYPLPSTLIMTVVPAQVAGVATVCACCPAAVDEVFGTAHLLKVSQVFQMGGAHAIAAFAYGTAMVPKADRIVGPGNIYVAAAKKLLAGETGIDFVAGPTEILIIAEGGDPRFLAADMLAQAEHDVDATAILLTTSESLAREVAHHIDAQLLTLQTAEVASAAIKRNSAIIVTGSLDEAVELSNAFAPEHLSIPDDSLLKKIRHAGSIFIGPFSPEAAGDYAAGPNHVLPTSGAARIRGGLSAADYVKVITVQQLTRTALRNLAPAITTLARAEGLEAHARSTEIRLKGNGRA
jgi:histidinol dehydrogenase